MVAFALLILPQGIPKVVTLYSSLYFILIKEIWGKEITKGTACGLSIPRSY